MPARPGGQTGTAKQIPRTIPPSSNQHVQPAARFEGCHDTQDLAEHPARLKQVLVRENHRSRKSPWIGHSLDRDAYPQPPDI
jgi:hypothetical protein